jgi:glycosyltransferase involved in cell wall biosynthesis
MGGGVVDGLLARKIRRLLKAPELRGAVDVLGRLAPAQVAAELAGASAFVLPSHIENSPNALCEAMLVGVPCIAAFVGGVPSLIQDGTDGLLYHDGDPYALAGKIDRLLGDAVLAARLGVGAREAALRRHDPERVAGQAVATYREILGRWRRRRGLSHPSTSEEVTP